VGCSDLHWPDAVANTASAASAGGSPPSHGGGDTSNSKAASETPAACTPNIEEDLSSVLMNFHNIRNGLLKRLKKVDKKRSAGQILTSLVTSSKTDALSSLPHGSPSSSALYCILQQLEAREPNATSSFC
jgi:hypothetical protein